MSVSEKERSGDRGILTGIWPKMILRVLSRLPWNSEHGISGPLVLNLLNVSIAILDLIKKKKIERKDIVSQGSFIFKRKYYQVMVDKSAAGLQKGIIPVFEKEH